jgi:hypothetical protein
MNTLSSSIPHQSPGGQAPLPPEIHYLLLSGLGPPTQSLAVAAQFFDRAHRSGPAVRRLPSEMYLDRRVNGPPDA